MIRRALTLFFTLSTLFYTSLIYANMLAKPDWMGNIELSIASGIQRFHSNDSEIFISEAQNDKVLTKDISTQVPWRFGIGTSLFDSCFANRTYFNRLGIELDYYNQNAKLKGQVWELGLPQFYNFRFKAPVYIKRLMLDLKPGLFTYNNFSPYAILGAGISWNRASYYETVIADDVEDESALRLHSHTQRKWVYDLGLGVRYSCGRYGVSLEYIYSYLNKVEPRDRVLLSGSELNPPSFTLRSQSLLLGLIVSIA